MSDTTVQECQCCKMESDCIDGLCEYCNEYCCKQEQKIKELTEALKKEKQAT